MQALNRKLLRDLWKIKGQGISISVVIGVGVLMFIMYLSAFYSLQQTRSTYYESYRFAHVFAQAVRAPLSLHNRIASIPGVGQVETRVVVDVVLDVEGLEEPATGRLISIPGQQRNIVNDLVLRKGRYIEPDRPDEVIVSEGFAESHKLLPGDAVHAILNGRRHRLEIVGIGLSPEYIYTIRPGELIPDDARFGIFWMERRALAAAFDMEGGFNDVALMLMPHSQPDSVIEELDEILSPYGGRGAIPRELQLSHWSVENELRGLQGFGMVVPVLFLGISAFLLHVMLRRVVAVQREQIAALKALGYSNWPIAMHYIQWGLVVGLSGSLLGTVLGTFLGRGMMSMYNQIFRFPSLEYTLTPGVVAVAIAIGGVGAILGAVSAVRQAIHLQPAEAMRPQPPAQYSVSLVERMGLTRLLTQPARIVLRNIERTPVRSITTVIGIACSVAILIMGTFSIDSLDLMMDVQFNRAQRQDIQLTFTLPVSASGIHALHRMPGVIASEPLRVAPVRLRSGNRYRQLAIMGLPAEGQLYRLLDVSSMNPVALPTKGLVISSTLANILRISQGETITVEVLEGSRRSREVVVDRILEEYMGATAYMEINSLRRLLGEGGTLSGGFLRVDEAELPKLYQTIKTTPAIAGATLKGAALEAFLSSFAQNIYITIFFNVLFASIIAFGVVYNAARVSLAERSRELASLRVMGFNRKEISAILLGELGLLTVVALPLGIGLGFGISLWLVQVFATELYTIPFTANTRTYAFCVIAIIVAVTASGLIVRRKLDRLNLLEVLKSRE